MMTIRSRLWLPVLMLVLGGVAEVSAGPADGAPEATAAAGRELGTLFFSPAQRLELEKERKGKPVTGPDGAVEEAGPVINGVATRSDGRLTVWVDGKPRWESASARHVVKLSSADVGSSAALLRSADASNPPKSVVPARKSPQKRGVKPVAK